MTSSDPFPTFFDLRSQHSELLQRGRKTKALPSEADVREFLVRAQATGTYLDNDSQRDNAQALMDYWATALYRLHADLPPAELEPFDPSFAPELAQELCPYVGLEPFHERDSRNFFGRQPIVDRLVERLRQERFVALLGLSGSGKSSVVMGGLLPVLRAGAAEGSERWRYFGPIVPGSNPLETMEKLVDVEELLSRESTPAVLVIDQFEELFTLCEDRAGREEFAATVARIATAPNARHTVIITMRSDFENYLARVPSLQEMIERGSFRLTPLTAGELRDVIHRPAERIGLRLEEGLVDSLVGDCLGEPAALPLLQFSLLRLWDNRNRNRITLAAYRQLGGALRAMERTADQLFESLLPEDQVIARRILLRMVRVTPGEVTRNRLRMRDVILQTENRERFERVLDKLAEARLVRVTRRETRDDDQIEVAHESLLRNWPRLVAWIEEARMQLRTVQRYEALADEWERIGRQAGLLDPAQLREAEQWLASDEAAEMGVRRSLLDFVVASRTAIWQTRMRGRNRARWLTVAIAAVLVALVGAVILQRRELAATEKRVAVTLSARSLDRGSGGWAVRGPAGSIYRLGIRPNKVPSLVRLPSGAQFDPRVARGIAERVASDTKGYFIGRNGRVRATVSRMDRDGDYEIDRAADPEDLGGPMFTEDGKLLGLLYAAGTDKSWVVPIAPLLRQLRLGPESIVVGTELVTAR